MTGLFSRLDRWLTAKKVQVAYQYFQADRTREAGELCKGILAAEPDNAEAHHVLGMIAVQEGENSLAIGYISRAIQLNGQQAGFYNSLGIAYYIAGDMAPAINSFLQALQLDADNSSALNNLGICYKDQGKCSEAVDCFRKAIALDPKYFVAYLHMASALSAQNDLDGALACLRRALAIKPDFVGGHSSLLATMNYLVGASQEELYREAQQFDLRHASGLLKHPPVFPNTRDPERMLKVGYVSADFREHSVAHFTRKLLGAHDRKKFEVYCYADVTKPDELTREFQGRADQWRNIAGVSDEDVAARVRSDGIDLLVDLSGHTAGNRLLVFARRPAPIQVSWLGYPNTTGMRAMDYRLTDAIADPPGEADRLHSEKLVRLEHGFLCYQTDLAVPEVSPPACQERGHVTFGSFNALAKTTPKVVRVWSQLLARMPDARLVLKSTALADNVARDRMLGLFGEHGVGPERLDLVAWLPGRQAHLELYARIDIALDPFPYNGTTTTCEALWMGVPVICLLGDRHAARVGASILQRVGLTELVAADMGQYVELAHALAGDRQRLAELRNDLRGRMRQSELMNLPLFTTTLEKAYRDMWRSWCG